MGGFVSAVLLLQALLTSDSTAASPGTDDANPPPTSPGAEATPEGAGPQTASRREADATTLEGEPGLRDASPAEDDAVAGFDDPDPTEAGFGDEAMSLGNMSLESLMSVDVEPAKALGAHTHRKNEWMLMYMYTYMSMAGNRDGYKLASQRSILQDYKVVPLAMSMQMHMLHLMYAPTDWLTLDLRETVQVRKMKLAQRTGGTFETRSVGIGDLRLQGLWSPYERNGHHFVLQTSLSFPTGSIEHTGTTPMGRGSILPYPMQIGSGTFDPTIGAFYLGNTQRWSWGAKFASTLRFGRNKRGYRRGNEYQATLWGERMWTRWFSTALEVQGSIWGNIVGSDPALMPETVPTADPNNQGGRRIDAVGVVNFLIPSGRFDGHAFILRAGGPLMQHLDGPQMNRQWILSGGWEVTW